MSIVLVIIGLLAGGVLVGRDLIRAAEIRSQLSQVEKYQTAVSTFRGKYNNYLPGDLPAIEAASFGFTARAGSSGRGDGNGALEGIYYAAFHSYGWGQNGENFLFWRDLSSANLIAESFNTATDAALSANITPTSIPGFSTYIPSAKIGGGNYIVASSKGYYLTGSIPINYFVLSVPTTIATDSSLWAAPGLTVLQAYALDSKIDDGLPQQGNVTATYISVSGNPYAPYPPNAATSSTTTCFEYTTGTYSITQNNGAGVNCALSFKFQ